MTPRSPDQRPHAAVQVESIVRRFPALMSDLDRGLAAQPITPRNPRTAANKGTGGEMMPPGGRTDRTEGVVLPIPGEPRDVGGCHFGKDKQSDEPTNRALVW
jgi:hypothetical protein